MIIDGEILEFYRRVVFGSNYDKTKIKECCFESAWRDMSQHTKKLYKKNLKDDYELVEGKTSNIDGYKDGLNDLKNNIFDKYFCQIENVPNNTDIRNIISEIANESEIVGKNDIYKVQLTIGLSQKLVNLFFKYIYTFHQELGLNKKQFKKCDCIIDNNNIERLNKDLGNAKTSNYQPWSQIKDITIYENFQDSVDKFIRNSNGKYKSRFDYEMNWK